jgi:WD40 repeat protein
MLRARPSLCFVAAALFASIAGCGNAPALEGSSSGTTGSTSSSGGTGGQPSVEDIVSNLPPSCSLECPAPPNCTEPETPFVCPTLAPWAGLPHDPACGAWDGTYPAVVKGQCAAVDPTSDAIVPAGPITGGLVLPDGHRIRPAGIDFVFAETNLEGGFPQSITLLPGTQFALVSDGGIQDNALRLIDLDALASGGAPVAGYTPFYEPKSLFWGMAWLPPGSALASGGGDGVVYAFDVDTTQGTLATAPSRDINVGLGTNNVPYYVGPIATTPDGQKLVIAPSDQAEDIRVFSLGTADYGMQLASIPVGSKAVFDLEHDPFDATGNVFYAVDQAGMRLVQLDVSLGTITGSVPLAKNPTQILFLDATYAAVTETDSDSIAIVDRAAGMVVSDVPVFQPGSPHGWSPSAIAWDPTALRIYATLAGINAVEVLEVTPAAGTTPPTITPAGRIPTAWWPTGVIVNPTDGSLVVITGKGHGTGTDMMQYTWGQGPITQRMHGSLQYVPASTIAALSAQTAIADENHQVAALAGSASVSCPAGVADFPIPADNTSGPSSAIKHVILVVRENKTYDGVFGDRPDLGDGDPALIMASDAELQGMIWQNAMSMAAAFTNFDNFYTDAEQSIQGHTWTVYGRTTDYMERTWLSIWGRGTREVETPTFPVDMPLEGGVFQWLSGNNVAVTDMGEIIGGFALDTHYPGLVYAQDTPDTEKSCYLAGHLRLTCDLASFTYLVQPNDHTYGGSMGEPAPEVMIAVNDEASGMILDALSHSPYWKDSLLIVTEDDPQDGGDHIDLHRSVLMMASPWVQRGHVSHGHYDMASVYKLVAHIFGIPYHNDMIANAMAPFDAFTSTPDYTPYTYQPRTVAAPCNAAGPHAKKAEQWDWDEPDDQPGLSQQIMEMMREPRAKRGVRVVR